MFVSAKEEHADHPVAGWLESWWQPGRLHLVRYWPWRQGQAHEAYLGARVSWWGWRARGEPIVNRANLYMTQLTHIIVGDGSQLFWHVLMFDSPTRNDWIRPGRVLRMCLWWGCWYKTSKDAGICESWSHNCFYNCIIEQQRDHEMRLPKVPSVFVSFLSTHLFTIFYYSLRVKSLRFSFWYLFLQCINFLF